MELLVLLQHQKFPLSVDRRQEFLQLLTQEINRLITNDFNQLLQLFYTIDIDEEKLKKLLYEQQDKDAAPLIATMMLARLEEKARLRQQNNSQPFAGDAELW